jgi:chromosome segregation ATPase
MAEKIIYEIEISTTDAEKNVDELTDSIVKLEKEQEELRKLLKKEQGDRAELSEKIAANQVELSKERAERKRNLRLIKAETNSRNQLKRNISKLTAERDDLNISTKEGRKELVRLNKEIDKQNKILKETGSKLDQQRLNIGNYEEAVSNAISSATGFNISLKSIGQTLTSAVGLIGALGAGVALLGKAYSSSARGAEDFNRISDRVNANLSILGNRLADLGGERRLDDIVGNILGALTGRRAKDIADQIVAIRSRLRQLSVDEIKQEAVRKKQLQDAEILRQIRDDETRSFPERIAANKELFNVINTRQEDAIGFQEARLELLNELLGFDKENLQLQEEIARIELELADIREENEGFRSEQLINQNQLLKEQEQQTKDLQKADEERFKTLRKFNETAQKDIEKFNNELEKQGDIIAENIIDPYADASDELGKLLDEEVTNNQARYDQDRENFEEAQNKKAMIAEASLNSIAQLTFATFGLIDSIIQKQLQEELEAVGDNEAARAEIEEKFAKKRKRLAIAEAVINGALAVLNALQTKPFVPLGIIAGATAATLTGIQIATIANTQFAKGGIVEGASHAHGGIPIHLGGNYVGEMEGGEAMFIINKQDSPEAVQAMAAINAQHGANFGTPVRYAQQGGEIDSSPTDIASAVRDAIKDITIVTRVTDINNVQEIDRETRLNAVV